jgi:hypothetical protein
MNGGIGSFAERRDQVKVVLRRAVCLPGPRYSLLRLRPERAGVNETSLGSKNLPRRDSVFPLLRLLVPLEMESILEAAVRGRREPKRARRLSHPFIYAHLAFCDPASTASGFPIPRP